MVVVPPLAEHEHRDDPVVAGLVAHLVVAPAPHVADRVHAEGRVLVEEDAHEPAPDQALDAAGPAVERVADRERDPERRDDPEQVHAVDRPDQLVVVQILPVEPALLHPEVREHPADMRVDESLERLAHPVTVPRVRRVRVALLVGERVVLPVIGDPLGQRPLHGHAAEDREGRLDGSARLEGAVGEVAVEPDRDSECANDIHCDHDRDVDGMERDVPESPCRDEDPERRDDDRDQRHDLADSARARPNSADGGLQRSSNGDGNFGHGQPIFARGRTTVVRIAIVGGGIAGLGAAYVLSRAHQVDLFERESRAGGHANTVVRDAVPLDTGFLVHNTQNYPLLCRLFTELGVRTHDSEMSFSVSCEGCGLEYSGPPAVRAGQERREPALPCAPVGDRPVAADRGPVAGRGRLRELVARGLPRRPRLLATVPLPLPGAADGRVVVDRARAGTRVPRGVRDPLLRESRDARVRALQLADRDRRKPRVRVGDLRSPRAGAARGEPGAVDPADGRRGRASRGGRRGTDVRQGGGCDARRRGTRAARGSERGGAERARRVRLYGQRDRAAHRLLAPAALPGGARLVELPHRRRRASRHSPTT